MKANPAFVFLTFGVIAGMLAPLATRSAGPLDYESAVLALVAGASTSNACLSRGNLKRQFGSCEELKAFRQRAASGPLEVCSEALASNCVQPAQLALGTIASGTACDTGTALKALNKNDRQDQVRKQTIAAARAAVEKVQRRRQHDHETLLKGIRDEIESKGITPKISLKELEAVSNSVHQHLMTYLARVDRERFKTCENTDGSECDPKSGFLENAYHWIAPPFSTKPCAAAENCSPLQGRAFQVAKRELAAIDGKGESADKARFEFLVKRAGENDTGQFQNDLTPYQARLLLLSWFESRVKMRARAEKMNARDILDSYAGRFELVRGETGAKKATWDMTFFHDGYLYAASKSEYQALFSENPTGSMGVDCSTLVEHILEKLSFQDKYFDAKNPASNGRIDTSHLISKYLKGVTVRPVCSEADLKPGDIIANKEHVMIFSGYQSNKSSEIPQMMIIEAVGHPSRTVHENAYDPYNGTATRDGCRRALSFLDPEKPMFVVDVSNMEQKKADSL